MYSVVGCRNCRALWIVEGRPETTECPRCGTRRQFSKLKAFAETETATEARRARAAMLAERSDDGEFVDPESVDLDAVGVGDETYLEGSGLDPDAVEAAGERASRGEAAGSRSRRRVVLDALEELSEPTADDVASYAAEAGVPAEYAERALGKLVRAGEVTETDGVYRRL